MKSELALLILTHAGVIGFYRPPTTRILDDYPTSDENIDLGDHLVLTPLLDEGDYKQAQLQSRVKPDLGNMTSFTGFLTVNEKCGSNLFFWFFPADKEDWQDAPLVLWLQGGPGSSSMFGLFEMLGPFQAHKGGLLTKREFSWNKENNLLFIDQPVGTGYSYSKHSCYPEDETAVGEDLYQAVVQIHKLFPRLQGNKFIITGESYAGHYIPALGHKIHKNNPSAKIKINLTAMMIGNGWVDPETQNDYGSYLYQLGLIGDAGKEEYDQSLSECTLDTQGEHWVDAYQTCNDFLGNLYYKHVGDVSVYNYLPDSGVDQYYDTFMQLPETQQAIHVGNLSFQSGYHVYDALLLDSVQSVKPWVEELLEEYPIIFYNGQLDIICGYPMMMNFLRSLSWSGQDDYLSARRNQWCVEKEQAGYYTGHHHLYDVLVRNAGHMVPQAQPRWAFQLISSVASGTKDDPLHGLTSCTSPTGI